MALPYGEGFRGGCQPLFAQPRGVALRSRRLSQFGSLAKVQDEHAMPRTTGRSEDGSAARHRAYGWGKVVSRRACGDEGPGLDLDFHSLASVVVARGQAVLQGVVEEVLRTPVKRLGDHPPGPGGARAGAVAAASSTLPGRGGTIPHDAPVCPGPTWRRDDCPAPPALATRRARVHSGCFGRQGGRRLDHGDPGAPPRRGRRPAGRGAAPPCGNRGVRFERRRDRRRTRRRSRRPIRTR